MKISGANTEHYVALNTLLQRDENVRANCVQRRTDSDWGWLRFALYRAKFWTLWIPKPSDDVCHKWRQYAEQCGMKTGLKSKLKNNIHMRELKLLYLNMCSLTI